MENIYELFPLPLSIVAHKHLHSLSDQLSNIRDHNGNDKWIFQWGNNIHMTKKIYNFLMGHHDTADPIKWIWKTCCLPRHKFFCWLMLNDIINTCELLTRKSFHLDSSSCVLCNDEDMEDRTHLLFSCTFSQNFWWNIDIEWNTDLHIHDMIYDGKLRYNIPFFMEIVTIGCWSLWNQRNWLIFENIPCSIASCKFNFTSTFKLAMMRANLASRMACHPGLTIFE